ncbi:hypothetical protein EJ04DRAFT_581686 [Polyplosphaeria fusca]|uniref:Trichothecene 3-O-acetyltransferase-like N-terminal domain-containing protein n=1 Tax=Polyplosphaeria fusca TaxID=682080 RepID=A0A9P4QII7_9PLEO|nr:hypothetical protein EJ04DRAFT_581686 [Polyplosphaeria fusca]
MTDLNEPLDFLGEMPLLHKLYTQIAFCWPVPDPSSHPTIIETISHGLERLAESFPWLAGQVVDEGNGSFKIKSYQKTPPLIIKDYRDDPSIPDWDTLKTAKFPMRMLDESVICPRNTLPDPAADAAPVLLLQISWINNGMILTINAAHDTMDMTGQAHIISLLAKACHSDLFTEAELQDGNPNRRTIIPLFDSTWTPGPELAHQQFPTVEPGAPTLPPVSPPPKSTWSYFLFSGPALAALKKTATTSLPSGFVSTDDVLTAYIWQSVLRARLPRLDPQRRVQMARAVDARRYLGVSPTYPGLLQNMAFCASPLDTLLRDPLGVVAAQFRAAVDPSTSDIGVRTRGLVTLLSRSRDKSVVNYSGAMDWANDVQLSSWSKFDCYAHDFNLGLGRPEAVRRPRFFAIESLFYLMPKAPDGEVAAALCLRDEDLGRLRADEEFAKFATYVG